MNTNVVLEHVSCDICGHDQGSVWLKSKDRGNGSFILQKCNNCGLIFLNPRPTRSTIGIYYPDDYGCFEPPKGVIAYLKKKLILYIASEYMGYEIGRKNLIKKYLAYPFRYSLRRVPYPKIGGKLLDIGCGIGKDLDIYKSLGWETYGVEINAAAVEQASKKGHNVLHGTLESAYFMNNFFDAVTMWDVIEHLHHPVDILKEINRILKLDGYFLLRAPNCDSLQARIFGDKWGAASHIPQHLYFFMPDTISQAAAKACFEPFLITISSSPLGFTSSFDRLWSDLFSSKFPKLMRILKAVDMVIGLSLYPIILTFGRGDIMTAHLRKTMNLY